MLNSEGTGWFGKGASSQGVGTGAFPKPLVFLKAALGPFRISAGSLSIFMEE